MGFGETVKKALLCAWIGLLWAVTNVKEIGRTMVAIKTNVIIAYVLFF
jgi:hypothetical protein